MNDSVQLAVFLEKLEKLKCPFLGIGDESWIEELLFKPGEQRSYVLNWLLSQFLGQTEDLGRLLSSPTNSALDSSLKRLTSSMQGLGLCKKNTDFIAGTSSITEQSEIWEYLLDNALMIKNYNEARLHEFGSIEDEEHSFEAQYIADCNFISNITRMGDFNLLFKDKINLLPPDVYREVELMSQDEHAVEPKDSSVSQLCELLKAINQNLCEEKASLEALNVESTFHADEKNHDKKRELLEEQMHVSSLQLLHSCKSFQQCLSTVDFSHDKPMPMLSSIGSTFENCSLQLGQFHKLLSSLSSIRESYKKLQDIHKLMTSSIRSHQILSDMTLSEATNILQESVSRNTHDVQ